MKRIPEARNRSCVTLTAVLSLLLSTSLARAQVGVFSSDDLIQYSHAWQGERFADGRPKVSDDILQRMKDVA